jgi:hypothetical protein
MSNMQARIGGKLGECISLFWEIIPIYHTLFSGRPFYINMSSSFRFQDQCMSVACLTKAELFRGLANSPTHLILL